MCKCYVIRLKSCSTSATRTSIRMNAWRMWVVANVDQDNEQLIVKHWLQNKTTVTTKCNAYWFDSFSVFKLLRSLGHQRIKFNVAISIQNTLKYNNLTWKTKTENRKPKADIEFQVNLCKWMWNQNDFN